MTKSYRAPNKRVIQRGGGGRFRRTTLKDLGIDAAELQAGFTICSGCRYGEGSEERWHPILKTGVCPRCGSRDKDEAEVLRQVESLAQREWEGLGEEGQRAFQRLKELTAGAFIDPAAMREIQDLRSRLAYDFRLNYLLQTLPRL